ncbi:MAG: hypothetical protein WCA56_10545 [Xanthobacteraceae bacterium]
MDDTTIVGDSVAIVTSPAQPGWAAAWSGISWSAVIAGAITAVAVSFIVIALGTGIGMELVSPYSYSWSSSASAMTVIGALWLVFAQAVGFATGGYVAARLRRSPTPMHSDEVKFRDGANGLVVWAIGVVVTSVVLAGAVAKVGSAVGSAASTAAVSVASETQAPSLDYFTDELLRPNPQNGAGTAAAGGTAAATPATPPAGGAQANSDRQQASRVLATALTPGGLSNDDRTYLAQIVAAQTGMSQDDAQHRVDNVVGQMKQKATAAAETARKATAYLSFWTFMSLLFGAVCATLGGVLGGDLRDECANRQLAAAAPR